MRKLNDPESEPQRKADPGKGFQSRQTMAESRYRTLRCQLESVESQLNRANQKKLRLAEMEECIDEEAGDCTEWMRCISTSARKRMCLQDLTAESIGAAAELFAKSALVFTVAAAAAVVPILGIADAQVGEDSVLIGEAMVAIASLIHVRQKVRGLSQDFLQAVAQRINERIDELDGIRKRLIRKMNGADVREDDW